MGWLIPWFQAINGLVWAAVFIQRLPGIDRVFRPSPSKIDVFGMPLPLTALANLGFSIRWFAWPKAVNGMEPAEMAFWAGLYALSAISGAMFFRLHFYHPREW